MGAIIGNSARAPAQFPSSLGNDWLKCSRTALPSGSNNIYLRYRTRLCSDEAAATRSEDTTMTAISKPFAAAYGVL